jgi:C-terminal processing protease CtpA/Prc
MRLLSGRRGVVIVAVLALAVTALVAGDRATCTRSAGECAAHTQKMYQTRGWMGVELEQNEDGSLRITSVVEGSPAEKEGLRVGDTLISVNDVTLSKDTAEAAMMKDDDWKIGGVLTLGLRRGVETTTVKVRLERIPETLLARIIEIHARDYHPIARN